MKSKELKIHDVGILFIPKYGNSVSPYCFPLLLYFCIYILFCTLVRSFIKLNYHCSTFSIGNPGSLLVTMLGLYGKIQDTYGPKFKSRNSSEIVNENR